MKKRAHRAPTPPPQVVQLLLQSNAGALPKPKDIGRFAAVYSFLAAEALERVGAASGISKRFLDMLDEPTRQVLKEKQRCSFNVPTDTTTMTIVKNANSLGEGGAQLLYHVAAGVVVLNSRKVYDGFAPHLDVIRPLTAEQFKDLYVQKFDVGAGPPAALRQCVLSSLTKCRQGAEDAGQNKLFQGSALYVERLAERCKAAWPQLQALIDQGHADPDLPVAPAVEVLQKELDLGPFVPQHLARVLSFFHLELYNIERLDCGAGAVQGLLLLHGATEKEAREWKQQGKLKPQEVKRLFSNLLEALPEEIRQLGASDLLDLAEKTCFFPYAARTLEHICCECRKAVSSTGRAKRRAATSQSDCMALWERAWPVYQLCYQQLSQRPRPQQQRFATLCAAQPSLEVVSSQASASSGDI